MTASGARKKSFNGSNGSDSRGKTIDEKKPDSQKSVTLSL
jgi:hypothetical protein